MRHLRPSGNAHTFGHGLLKTTRMGFLMSRIGTSIATIAAAAGGIAAAFLAFSPAASADPVAPAVPPTPGIDLMSQLANAPALAGQFLQSAATMLQKPAAAAAPAAPPPSATASINLPQAPSAAPLTAPLTQAVGTVPQSPVGIPGAPGQLPLLNQLPLPGNIASITQNIPGLGGTGASAIPSIPGATAPVAAPPAATIPMTPPAGPGQSSVPPNLNPFSALP
jgi:hypothetical protein